MQAKHKLMFYCVLIVIRVIFAAPPPALVPITGGAALKDTENSAYSGVPWPIGRFVQIKGINGQPGCTLDKLTGLMWVSQPYHIKNKIEAINNIATVNKSKVCGYDDWRWSNLVEIKSLIHWGIGPGDNWYQKHLPMLKELTSIEYYVPEMREMSTMWIVDFKTYQIRRIDITGFEYRLYYQLLVRGGYREP